MRKNNTRQSSTQSSKQTPPLNGPDHYIHHEICPNCGSFEHLEIPRGTRVAEYLRGKHCSNCGCALRESPFDRHEYMMDCAFLDEGMKLMDEAMRYFYDPKAENYGRSN